MTGPNKRFDIPAPGSLRAAGAPDPVDVVLKYMNPGFRCIVGSPLNFCRVLCELTEGAAHRPGKQGGLMYGWYSFGGTKKDILGIPGIMAYEIVREANKEISLKSIDQQEYQRLLRYLNEHPLSVLISKFELEKEYRSAMDIYRKKQDDERLHKEAEQRRTDQEDHIDAILKKIEAAHSDEVIFPIRGIHNIHALIERGYVPGICDNPELWVDADEFASLYFKNSRTGEETLLIGREKLQAVTELSRIAYKFLVAKSKDKPRDFAAKFDRFNKRKPGEAARNWNEDFFKGLDLLTTYPEELKNRTVTDLDIMARAIDGVIGERSRIEEGLLPVEALFQKDTRKVLAALVVGNKPLPEIRKALDYFEHTGMVHAEYKDSLYELIQLGMTGIALYEHLAKKDQEQALDVIQKLPPQHKVDIRKILEGVGIKGVSDSQTFKDFIYTNGEIGSAEIRKKRIKQIVTMILKSIPGEIDAENITAAMQPYIEELGLDELDRIKKRILELKAVVAAQRASL